MKKVFMLVFLIVTLVTSAAADIHLKKITEKVYVYTDTQSGLGVNAGIVIGDDGIVVIDTLVSAKAARSFIQDIQSVSDKPIKYVINTHYHLDHTFGNAEFVKLGATVIAQENAKKSMKDYGNEMLKNIKEYGLTPEQMQGTELAYPVITYQKRMTLDIGGQLIELIYASHAHTEDDTLVYLPDQKILFASDILFTDHHPFLGEGNIKEWVARLETIESMDLNKIIPGHGPVSDKDDVKKMKEYLLLFDKKAKELAAQSDNAQDIANRLQKALPVRSEGANLIPLNIQMKYMKKE
ncbi:MAG: MBL fold metallo-hydrolase [Candidatus Electrothrix sp. AW3_4]|nr:MBL fold metallo-hydrolase [Candidatus Electrothrix gigas]